LQFSGLTKQPVTSKVISTTRTQNNSVTISQAEIGRKSRNQSKQINVMVVSRSMSAVPTKQKPAKNHNDRMSLNPQSNF